MIAPSLRPVLLSLAPALIGCASAALVALVHPARPVSCSPATEEEEAMQVHYLEIVTSDVDATCDALAALHGLTFSPPAADLGQARTASLKNGGRVGVRAPMHDAEGSVVRPYVLVDDIEAAVEAAAAAGGEIAMTPTEIPGRGRFAIYFLGGNQYGLWER